MRRLAVSEMRGSKGISSVFCQSMMIFWVARRVLAQKGGYPKRHSNMIIPRDHLPLSDPAYKTSGWVGDQSAVAL